MIQKNSASQIWYLAKLSGFFTSIGRISICFREISCNAILFPFTDSDVFIFLKK